MWASYFLHSEIWISKFQEDLTDNICSVSQGDSINLNCILLVETL